MAKVFIIGAAGKVARYPANWRSASIIRSLCIAKPNRRANSPELGATPVADGVTIDGDRLSVTLAPT